MRYVWAVTLVALGLLIGFILQPAFGRSQAYATFYPVVLVAAYVLGPKPASVATVLSAAVAYWCLIPPDFQWKWDNQVGAALGFFLVTSAVAIYLIDRLVRVVTDRAQRNPAPAELARVNAVIFADLAARNIAPPRPMLSAAEAMAGWRAAPVLPSERSFEARRSEPETEPEAIEPGARRKAEAPLSGERPATLH